MARSKASQNKRPLCVLNDGILHRSAILMKIDPAPESLERRICDFTCQTLRNCGERVLSSDLLKAMITGKNQGCAFGLNAQPLAYLTFTFDLSRDEP